MSPEKKIEELEKELALYRQHSDVRAFFAMNRMANQYIDYLNEYDLKLNIGADPKTDKVFDRAQKILDSIGDLATQIADLKVKLKLTGDETKDLAERKPFTERLAQKRE